MYLNETHNLAISLIKNKILNCPDKHVVDTLKSYIEEFESYTKSLENCDGPINIFFVGKSKVGKSTFLQNLTKKRIFPRGVDCETIGLWKLTISSKNEKYHVYTMPYPKNPSPEGTPLSWKGRVENDENSFLNACKELTRSKINSDGSWDHGGQINLVTPISFCPHMEDFVIWDTPGISEGRLKHQLLRILHQNIVTSFIVFLVQSTSGTLETEENLFILSDYKTLQITDKITFVITQIGEFIRKIENDMKDENIEEEENLIEETVDHNKLLEFVNDKLYRAFINPIKMSYPDAEVLVSEFSEDIPFEWDQFNCRFCLSERKKKINPSNQLVEIMKKKRDKGREEYIEKLRFGLFKKLCTVIETLTDVERAMKQKAEIEEKVKRDLIKQSHIIKTEMMMYLQKGILDDVTSILNDFDRKDKDQYRASLSKYIIEQVENLNHFLPLVIENKFKKKALDATANLLEGEEDIRQIAFRGLDKMFSNSINLGHSNSKAQTLGAFGLGMSGGVMAIGIGAAIAAGSVTAGLGSIVIGSVLAVVQSGLLLKSMVGWNREDVKKILKGELYERVCGNGLLLNLINSNIDKYMDILKDMLLEDRLGNFFRKRTQEELDSEDLDIGQLFEETSKKLSVLSILNK